MKTKAEILASLQGGLIASCQVKKDDPQYIEGLIPALAKGAIWGGAVGLRIDQPETSKRSELLRICLLLVYGKYIAKIQKSL